LTVTTSIFDIVTPEVDAVNMTGQVVTRPYHHGRLREALVDAGVDLARAGGPEAVVLRSVSREAGVSHNAAYRHFADRDDLLRAVCARCMTELALLMEVRVEALSPDDDPALTAWLRLEALGRAYVEFALTEPGWFATAFAVPRSTDLFGPGEGVGASGLGPFGLLNARLDDLVTSGALPAERRPGAEYAAWSAVHGISGLLVDGPLRGLPEEERERALRVILGVIVRGL
jgi:AcrR family transcriptional regulator